MTQAGSTPLRDADGYEICIQGSLDPRWSTFLGGAHVSPDEDGTTVLTSRVVDQAALHGLLATLQGLGLPLISVTRVDPNPPDHSHHDTTGEPT